MYSASTRVSLLAVALAAVLPVRVTAEESNSLAYAGTGRLPTQIVGVVSPAARTYGTAGEVALALSSEGFAPIDSTTTYTYSTANSGQYITGGHRYLFHSVVLPEGALVTAIELDGCDNDGSGYVNAWFSRCTVGSSCTDISGVGTLAGATPGCGRFSTTLAPPVTIDNFNNSYSTYFSTTGGENAAVRAIRIYYKLQVSPAPIAATFGDVPTTHLYFRAIEALAASGITTGCGSGNFCPDQPVTRGEVAKFLANALGLHWSP